MESLYSFIDEINTNGKFTLTKNSITFCDQVYQIFSIVCPNGKDLFLYQTPEKNNVSYDHFEVIESKKPFRVVLPKGRSKIPSHKTFQIQESPFNLSVLFFNGNPVYYSIDSPFEWKPYKNFNAIQIDGSLLTVSDYYFENQEKFETPQNNIEDSISISTEQQVSISTEQDTPQHLTEEQVSHEHLTEEQVIQEYVEEQEVIHEYVSEEQVTHEHLTEEQVTQEYVSEEYVSEEQVTEEQVTQEYVEEQQIIQEQVAEEDIEEDVEEYDVEEIEKKMKEIKQNENKKKVSFEIEEEKFEQILQDYQQISSPSSISMSVSETTQPSPKLSSIQFVHNGKKFMIPCMKFIASDKLNFYQLHTYSVLETNKMEKDKYAFYLPEKNKYYLAQFGRTKYLLHISNQLLIVTNIQQKQTNMYKTKDIFKLDNHPYLFTGQSVFVPMEHKKYFDNQYGTIKHVFIPKTNYV